ncbi:response regulator [Aquiflexum sp.]|uniref:response regulator n=1 Tax=Aquiflexum sp. TaxID=1872584 RepID=UPI003592F409
MKFLVVDDEKDVELLFQQKLRKEIRSGSIELEFAFSGNEALEIMEKSESKEVMYIFSDINMPGMTGLELLDKLKTKFPQIPVSMISAYGDSENYEKAIELGAKEFFVKPINFENLKVELNKIIEDKEPKQD